MPKQQAVAFIATGDEIVDGDILNSNVATMAHTLKSFGVNLGIQFQVADVEEDIRNCLQFALQNHAVVILIGGLGPTEDDLTRFALSAAIDQPLVFHQTCWDRIVTYITKFHATISENNKQQCLFPEDATILVNEVGTADGCHVILNSKKKSTPSPQHIFLLPGPPNQCLPLAERYIYPLLKKAPFAQPFFRKHWLLIGASESILAEKLSEKCRPWKGKFNIGYRYASPYLEVKLNCHSQQILLELSDAILADIKDFLFANNCDDAITVLQQHIMQKQQPWVINDQVTDGALQQALSNITTQPFLSFKPVDHTLANTVMITIQPSHSKANYTFPSPAHQHLAFELTLNINDNIKQLTISRPAYSDNLLEQYCHWIAASILRLLSRF